MQDIVSSYETKTTIEGPVDAVVRRDHAVQVLLRTAKIMDVLRDRPEIRVTDLAREVGLHKATVHRLLATLEQVGYVMQNQETGCYSLGLKIVDLARALPRYEDIRTTALPMMLQLVHDTNETVHLGVLENLEVVCIESVVSTRPVAIGRLIGKRPHPHVSSMGKVLYAYQGPRMTEQLLHTRGLPRFTPNTICDPEAFRQHLDQVRDQGYAINAEEEELGIRCVAAPIRDRSNHVVGALSVAAPSPRLLGDHLAWVVRCTMAAADKVHL